MLVHIINSPPPHIKLSGGTEGRKHTHDLPLVHKYVKINYRLPGGKCLKTAFITAVFVSLFSSGPVTDLTLYEKTSV
jgi:hypothetical protein